MGSLIEEVEEAFHIRWTKRFLLFLHLSEDFLFMCILALIIVYFQNRRGPHSPSKTRMKKKKEKTEGTREAAFFD